MKLQLKLNDFFRKYDLFTISNKLLNSVKESDFQLDLSSRYPNLSKVLTPDVLNDTIASLIYLNKGSYESFGILAKAMGTDVKIYDSNNGLLYDSINKINNIPTTIGLIEFSSIDYSISEEFTSAIKDLAKELLWYVDSSTSIKSEKVKLELVNNNTYYNECSINYFDLVELT